MIAPMSVHHEHKSYRVRWRDQNGRRHSRSFTRKTDADLFDAEIKRRKQLGPHLIQELTRSAETLDDFIRGPWRNHAAGLAPKTRAKYAWVLDNHLLDLGDEPLAAIDVARLTLHQRRLLDRGVRPNTVREILRMISGILQIAVEHGRIPGNPVRSMRKVRPEPRRRIRVLEPAQTEALISAAHGRDRIIIVLGAHLGLRPIEIRSVTWQRLVDSTLSVDKADTKPSARPRTIAVPAATLLELKQWRLQSGRPHAAEPIVGAMDARALNAWNTELRALARQVLGHNDLTVYTLRHSHASALHYAGYTVASAASRMGHSGVVHLTHYAHVIDALESRPKYADLDALIAAARGGEGLRHAQ